MSDEEEAIDQDDEEEVEADSDTATSDAVGETEAADAEDEVVASTPAGRAARSELPEAHSVAARAALRNTLAADVEAFLARGGSIQEVPDDDRAEAPKKPDNNYGRRSV